MIKKIILWLVVLVVVVVVVGIVAVALSLDKIVKTGIETVGPKMTQTKLTVDSVNLSLLSGSAGINGLVLGNPEGFKTPQAISVGKAAVSIVPGSIMSDKVVIHSVEVRNAEITFEGSPYGANNLKKIMDNVNEMAGSAKADAAAPAATPADKKAGKKLQVDDFLISGAKVHASITGIPGVDLKEITVPIPDIHFSDLGKGPEGITAAELTQLVLKNISAETMKAVGDNAKNLLGDAAKNVLSGVATNGVKAVGAGVDSLKKGLGGLLGK
jgi:hypothetical protein